jgi:hypothetical protein
MHRLIQITEQPTANQQEEIVDSPPVVLREKKTEIDPLALSPQQTQPEANGEREGERRGENHHQN